MNKEVRTPNLVILKSLFVILSSLGLLCTTVYADPVYETFTELASGRKFKVITLREYPTAYLVATAEGIRTLNRNEARRSTRTSLQGANLDHLLRAVENWIRKSRFGTAKDEQPRLKKAIAAFDEMVKPKLRSTVATQDFKAAIRHAQNYYTQQYQAVAPTIQALRLATQISQLSGEIAARKKAVNARVMLLVATLSQELARIPPHTPLAKRERRQATARLVKLTRKCFDTLLANAVKNFADTRSFNGALDLMQSLKECAEYSPIFTGFQKELVDTVTGLVAKSAAPLPATARSIFRFDRGEIRLERNQLNKQMHTLRNANDALTELGAMVFGAQAKALQTSLAGAAATNRQALAEAAATRDGMSQLRKNYRAGVASLHSSKYAQAIVQLEALKADAAARLRELESGAGFSRHLARLIAKARARELLQRLRSAPLDQPEKIRPLLTETRRFLASHSQELKGFGVRASDYKRKVAELGSYIVFFDNFKLLKAQMNKLPKKTWYRMEDLGKRLEQGKKDRTIHPRAQKDWQQFLHTYEERIFRLAVAEFTAGNYDLEDERDQKVLVSLVQHYLQQKQAGAAAAAVKLLETVLERLAGDDKADRSAEPFAKALLDLELKAVRQLSVAGHPMEAISAIYDRLKQRFPAYADEAPVQRAQLELLDQLARGHQKRGEGAKAIVIYERLCREYPAYAASAKLFDRLLGLKQEFRPKPFNRETWWQTLDDYCQKFPGQLASTAVIKQVLAAIIGDYEIQWETDEHPRIAAENFIALWQKHPNLMKETDAIREIIRTTREKLNYLLQDEQKLIPPKIIEGLGSLVKRPEFASEVSRERLDQMLVEFKLRQAKNLLQLSQTGALKKAFTILQALQKDFPKLATDRKVARLMRQWQRRYYLEQLERPLGIRYPYWDWPALAVWVILWFWLLARAVSTGRRFRHLRYSLGHFLTLFAIFLGLLAVFLFYGSFNHLLAAGLAWIIPGVFCNALGLFTYAFFPMIYGRRRVNLGKALLRVGAFVPGLKSRLPQLKKSVDQLEADLPLLRNRWLFRLQHTAHLAEEDPEKAYKRFQKLYRKLTHELLKDASWNAHRINCLFNLGQLAWELGKTAEAEDYLKRHLEEEPRAVDTHELLAWLYMDREDYESAIPHLKVCLAVEGSNDELWYHLGCAFFESGKFTASYKCFEAVKEKDRDVIFQGARAYARAGMHQKSVEWFQSLFKLNPADGEALYYLASTFARLNESAKAAKVIGLTKDGNPYFAHALALQGNLLYQKGKLDKAGEFFTKALGQSPELLPALLGQGQLALEAGRHEQAAECFDQLLQLQPEHHAANYYSGVILEHSGADEQALARFTHAATDPEFNRLAVSHLGRIHFFREEYDKAREYLGLAEAAGESSPWFLFLYAYALASEKEFVKCERVLLKIFGHADDSAEWQAHSFKAMYSLGYRLFEGGAYQLSLQCLEYVQERLGQGSAAAGRAQVAGLADLIEETRFRLIVELLGNGDYLEALSVVSELQLSLANLEKTAAGGQNGRYRTCQYYMGLCQLFSGDFGSAHKCLSDLHQTEPMNPRYLYHLLLAELGLDRPDPAARLLIELNELSEVPWHIKIGMEMVRAYMLGLRDRYQEAEQILADSYPSIPAEGSPGTAHMRQKLLLSRAYYLCRVGDTARLQFLLGEMTEQTRGEAAYLQALASLTGTAAGSLGAVLTNLQPFAEESAASLRLFTTLSCESAGAALGEGNWQRALEILAKVSKPPAVIAAALRGLRMAETLTNIEDLTAVNSAITTLAAWLRQPELSGEPEPALPVVVPEGASPAQKAATPLADEWLPHSLIHNLGILYLKRALLPEKSREKTNVEEYWDDFWAFWHDHIFGHEDYWQAEQERLSAAPGKAKGQALDPVRMELEFRAQVLLNVFLGHILTYLSEGSAADLQRHLNYLTTMGTEDNQLPAYMKKLGAESKAYVDSLDKNAPALKTWDFVISYAKVQLAVQEVLKPEATGVLYAQLEDYELCRQRYASPADYMQARRLFNTLLLEALQMGINGRFSQAGEKVENCLAKMPPGLNLGQFPEDLYKLREQSRKPAAASERGVNLSLEFERMYQRAVKATMQQKGS